MMKKKWWHDSVVYQIYPRSFKDSNGDGIGDIMGIIEKLPYLKKLGIDVIWLCPIYDSPNKDNGYDISDYYNIMEENGTMAEFDLLLLESHKLGIKIIMDLVVNHVSDQHEWFLSAKDNKESPYRDYFVWQNGPVNELPSVFSGSAWEEYPQGSNEYYLHLFTKEQPDLNWESEALRSDIYRMMNFWLDKGIDGFRMDVIDLIGKVPDQMITENGPRLHEYLQEMHQQTFGHRNVLTVGETWGATPEIGQKFSAEENQELSMIFQFEHLSVDEVKGKTRWDLAPLDYKELKQVLSKWQEAFKDTGWNSLFWNNHDTPRIVSRWGDDQKYRVESAKMFAILQHLMKGTPYIYQGEELGMTNIVVSDIDDVDDVQSRNLYNERITRGYSHEALMEAINTKGRDNARTPMQWDTSDYAGFSEVKPWLNLNPNYSTINVEQSLDDPNSVFYTYQKLISLRKEYDLVVYGDFKEVRLEDDELYGYTREWQGKIWLVITNLGANEKGMSLPNYMPIQTLISNYEKEYKTLKDIKLSPYEAFVVEV